VTRTIAPEDGIASEECYPDHGVLLIPIRSNSFGLITCIKVTCPTSAIAYAGSVRKNVKYTIASRSPVNPLYGLHPCQPARAEAMVALLRHDRRGPCSGGLKDNRVKVT
jgi:hypothetical protein